MKLRRLLAAAICAASLAAPAAHATNVGTDVTDIWWPNNEPGWGIQLIQNADVVFATMFIYDPENEPFFVVATLFKAPGADVYTGEVSVANGTYFGVPWNPADVGETVVGTMTFTLTSPGTGTLAYSIGPTNVTKSLARQPLRLENNAGDYRITHTWTSTGAGCTAADVYNPSGGPVNGDMAIQAISAETALVSLTWQFAPVDVCSMTATYFQTGRLGGYGGALACPSSGRSGFLTIYEVANRPRMLTARYVMEWDQGCTRSGQLTAISAQP
jgi:hypothetical protein